MWLPGAPSDGRATQAEEERGCPRTVHLVGPQCKISHVTQPAGESSHARMSLCRNSTVNRRPGLSPGRRATTGEATVPLGRPGSHNHNMLEERQKMDAF